MLAALLREIRSEAGGQAALMALVDDVEAVAERLLRASVDDRLSGSAAFLEMLAVAVAGWLMARQLAIVEATPEPRDFHLRKAAAARFFLTTIVPEASGLRAAATLPADLLYSLPGELLAT